MRYKASNLTSEVKSQAIKELRENGFLVLEQVFRECDLNEVEKSLDRLFFAATCDGICQPNVDMQSPTKFDNNLRKNTVIGAAKAISEIFLGSKAIFRNDHSIYKTPHCNSEINWHQDDAYGAHILQIPTVTCWIPLQDVDRTNGCMSYVRMNANAKILEHRAVVTSKDRKTLTCEVPLDSNIIECPLRAGDMIMHVGSTIHRSENNESDRIRKAWILSFARQSDFYIKIPFDKIFRLVRSGLVRS